MLNFKIIPYEAELEATVPGGYYTIYPSQTGYIVTGYVQDKLLNIGDFPSILEAIESANKYHKSLVNNASSG